MEGPHYSVYRQGLNRTREYNFVSKAHPYCDILIVICGCLLSITTLIIKLFVCGEKYNIPRNVIYYGPMMFRTKTTLTA